MPYPEKFTGFQVNGPDTWLEFHKNEFQPKPFGDYDVDVKIECCGVCGSDVHTISGGWGEQHFPLAVGHEIVGKAIRVGPKVTLIQEGQRVGVGAQSYACLECRQCKNENETYCKHQLDTYGAVWPDSGVVSQGGYSSHVRTHQHWVFPIPDALESTVAAPMLCAGLTAYSPLVRNGCGPGKKVGIVGLGGIGHFGVLFAKALGAEVWAISRSHSKEADAKAMGADGFLATQDKDWNKPHEMTFDLIINCANSMEGFDLDAYLSLLDVHGKFVSVGLPEGEGVKVRNQTFLANGCFIGTSHLGSRRETLEMLQLAADKGIKTWVEEKPISEEGLKEIMQKMKKSDVRYRFCMTNYEEQFGA
ncbi:chaperonin 10-like protein [Coniochaeta sp. 2T2.1]|nr:chaperonin 10-like protein [Coniochaeta sp. 2T2.1]